MIALTTQHDRRPAAADPDAQLMLRVRNGDREAFNQLTVRHSPRVQWLITYLMGSDAQSEDLTQEVFLRAYRARHSYVPTSKFTTWLITIAKNVVANARRSHATRRERTVGTVGDTQSNLLEHLNRDVASETPHDALVREEGRRVVHAAVAQLADRQRSAVMMFHFDGMSYAAIGEAMSASQEAVKSLLHRARANLRGCLTPYVDNGDPPRNASPTEAVCD